jgi:hypothetical protein
MVKRYAGADKLSMNSWIEGLLDIEDMRRRCEDHGRFMAAHPEAVALTTAWADRSMGRTQRGGTGGPSASRLS